MMPQPPLPSRRSLRQTQPNEEPTEQYLHFRRIFWRRNVEMKVSVAIAVCFILFLDVVSSRKCYKCNSGTSLEDCETTQREISCTGSEEKCFQFKIAFSVGSNKTKIFEKGCEAPDKCEQYDKDSGEALCKDNLPAGESLDACMGKCCSGDLCNKENIFNGGHISSRKCYKCNSGTSREDCETTQQETNCTGSEEKCFQFEIAFSVGSTKTKIFEKGCEAPDKCEQYDKDSGEALCKDILPPGKSLDSCMGKCCSGDLCNKEKIFNGGHISSRKCYKCNSGTSREDCETTQREINCTGSEEKCFQFEIAFSVGSTKTKSFEKGCKAPDKCEQYDKDSGEALCKDNLPPGKSLDSCMAKCCSSDLCNKENIFNGGHMVFGSFLLSISMIVIFMTI